jgi:hypothetical protein
VAWDTFYWAAEAVKLRPESNPNFIDAKMQKAPQRRIFAKVVSGGTALGLAASLGASAYFLVQARREAANLKVLSLQVAELRVVQGNLRRQDDELSRKGQVIKLVLRDRPPPSPAWLFAYLGEAVPPGLVVTNFQVKRHDNLCQVRLEGTFQEAVQASAPAVPASALGQFRDRLAGEPFHLQFPKSGDNVQRAGPGSPPAGDGAAAPDWLSRVTTKGITIKSAAEEQFVIEGVMP